jgi:hypothetical protein
MAISKSMMDNNKKASPIMHRVTVESLDTNKSVNTNDSARLEPLQCNNSIRISDITNGMEEEEISPTPRFSESLLSKRYAPQSVSMEPLYRKQVDSLWEPPAKSTRTEVAIIL